MFIQAADRDKLLTKKLEKEELPGILAWAVEGCLKWQEIGLGEPSVVTEATEKYRQESDAIGCYIDECCVIAPDLMASTQVLYDDYTTWCIERGEIYVEKREFAKRLTEKGFVDKRTTGGKHVRKGLGVKHTDIEDDAPVLDNPFADRTDL